MSSFRVGRVLVGVSVIALTGLGLSGCSTADPTPTISSESTASESASPAPTSTAALSGTPITLGCNEILTLQNVYDFNPNYGQDPNFTVPDQIAPLKKINGMACGWVNQTSGDTFAVGVAKPDAASLAVIANDTAASYSAVPTYGTSPIEGYFGVKDGIGVATVFANGYWIVLTSSSFWEPGDATPLVQSIIANLH